MQSVHENLRSTGLSHVVARVECHGLIITNHSDNRFEVCDSEDGMWAGTFNSVNELDIFQDGMEQEELRKYDAKSRYIDTIKQSLLEELEKAESAVRSATSKEGRHSKEGLAAGLRIALSKIYRAEIDG